MILAWNGACMQFQFIISAVLTQYVLGYARPLSVLLQSKTCDLVKTHTEARNLVSLLAGLKPKRSSENCMQEL